MERLHQGRRRRRWAGGGAAGEPTDALLLAELDRTFADALRRAGDWLVCRPGCSKCCFGPFPITRLDAIRLRDGFAHAALGTERVTRIRMRAEEAVRLLRDGFPGDPGNGKVTADESRLDRFFAKHAALACPVLDPDSGRCELYEHRPVACRTYGPPLRHGARDAPHCSLCFEGATPADLERCRVEPDAEGLEQELLKRLGVKGGDEWETLIAFAVLA